MSKKEYSIGELGDVWLDYDRQNDILYINFGETPEEADEEVLSEDGDIAFRIKEGRIVSIMIMRFSEKIGVTII